MRSRAVWNFCLEMAMATTTIKQETTTIHQYVCASPYDLREEANNKTVHIDIIMAFTMQLSEESKVRAH